MYYDLKKYRCNRYIQAAMLLSFSLCTHLLYGQDFNAYIDVPEKIDCPKFKTDSARVVESYVIYRDARQHLETTPELSLFRNNIWFVLDSAPGFRKTTYIDAAAFYRKQAKGPNAKAYLDTLVMIAQQRMQCFGDAPKVQYLLALDLCKIDSNNPSILPLLEKIVARDRDQVNYFILIEYVKRIRIAMEAGERSFEDFEKAVSISIEIIDKNLKAKQTETTRSQWENARGTIEQIAADVYDNATLEQLLDQIERKGPTAFEDAVFLQKTYRRLRPHLKDVEGQTLAIKILEALHQLETDQSLSEWRYRLAKLYKITEAYRKGIELLEPILQKKSTSTQGSNPASNPLSNPLSRVETIVNQHAAELLLLAYFYKAEKQFSNAYKAANLAVKSAPDEGAAHYFIGDLLMTKTSCKPDNKLHAYKHIFAALDAYEAALRDPDYSERASERIKKYSEYLPAPTDLFYLGITEGSIVKLDCWVKCSTKVRAKR